MTPEQLRAAAQGGAKRQRRVVPLILDGDLRREAERVEALLAEKPEPNPNDRRMSSKGKTTVPNPEAVAQLTDLRERTAAATLHVVIESLPGTEWRKLMAAHPPRRDGDGKINPYDLMGFNEETARRPMVRACVIGHKPDPEGERVEQIDAGVLDWLIGTDETPEFVSDLQMDKLVAAVMNANRGDDAVPLPQLPSTTTTSVEG